MRNTDSNPTQPEERLSAQAGKPEWSREYTTLNSIPSSHRDRPAQVLLDLLERLPPLAQARVLDAGCGTGRNSIFLAKRGCDVVAVDYCEPALNELRKRSSESSTARAVQIRTMDLHAPLPFPDESFDLVLDMYVSCHFLADDVRDSYWKELRRVLRRGGYALSAQFSTEDSYYRELAGNGELAFDPANNITKRLYSPPSLRVAEFVRALDLVHMTDTRFADSVRGVLYNRSILGLLLRKPMRER